MEKGLQSGFNEMIILTDRQRNCNIDLLRVLACAAVVGLHTIPKDLSVSTASLYYLCGFAVPFFFMASGYFLLNRGDINMSYSLHKIVGIIRIVLGWNTILVALKLVKQLHFDGETTVGLLAIPVECIKSLVQKGYMWQFWYLGALLILYVLLPTISRLSRKAKCVLMLSVGIIAVALETISIMLLCQDLVQNKMRKTSQMGNVEKCHNQ